MSKRVPLSKLNDEIEKLEARLKPLYAKRAGRNVHEEMGTDYSWRFCKRCGAVKVLLPDLMCSPCVRADELDAELAVSQARLRSHDAGEHLVTPDPFCIECYHASRAKEEAAGGGA